MADLDIKLTQEDFLDLMNRDSGIAELLTTLLNQVIASKTLHHVQAKPYERTDDRTTYRNGYRSRTLHTRVGTIKLQIPQLRDGKLDLEIFDKYQRSEKALMISLMEMYVQGVSTRKVSKITEELCGTQFSKSTVSKITAKLDPQVEAWQTRSLAETRYPFMIVDALVINARVDHEVRSLAFLIAYGINESGHREILGIKIGDSENEVSWRSLFTDLKSRGLHGVDWVISDAHKGLVNAVRREFQGAIWQRCQVHFMRNVLSAAPRKVRAQIADRLKLIFYAESIVIAKQLAKDFIRDFESSAERAVSIFEDGFEASLSILILPKTYRKRTRTTNLAERCNEEIRRRERVVRVFPNEKSAMRLIGAVLIEMHENWKTGQRYFDMQSYWDWHAERAAKQNKNKVVTFSTTQRDAQSNTQNDEVVDSS